MDSKYTKLGEEIINDAEADIDAEIELDESQWGEDDPRDPKWYDDSLTPPDTR